MSKVKKITVSNLKAISALTADFDGCTAIITGGNNKGKSSFLKSLPNRLKQLRPEVILKDGESDGYAEWELTTGEKFIWQFDNKTKAGEKLIFITKDNIKTSITRDIANRYFPKGLDIDKFLSGGPKVQRDMLQKIVGVDFSDIDAKYKEAYENRTVANRVAEIEKAKLVPILEDLDPPIDYEGMRNELQNINAHNEKIEYVKKGVKEKQDSIDRLKSEIERLESDVNSGNKWLSKDENKPKNDEYIADLKINIEEAVRHNALVYKNDIAKDIKLGFDKAEKEAKEADKKVKAIEKQKKEMIKTANLPDGFGFSENGVTYEGRDLDREQISSSSIYIAALKLASLNIGEVKTLHFDASYLDKNSLSDIEKWAKENKLQLLIERPDFDGGEIEYQIISE